MIKRLIVILFVFISFCSKAQSPDFIWAWMSGNVTMYDSTALTFWGFSDGFTSPTLPGPTIYVTEGDSVDLKFRNQSMVPHTIHLHGLDVNQANDGVPQTSYSLFHGEESNYRFKAPHPGTYLYHCHVASVLHVQMGMYGMLIVNAKDDSLITWTNGYEFDTHHGWVLSEIDKFWFDNVPNHSSGPNIFDVFPVPDYNPDYFLVNGKSEGQIEDLYLSKEERFYLRLANIGNYFNTVSIPEELNPLVVSSDGRPLPNALNGESLIVLPGERYGVLLTPEEDYNGQIEISYANMNTYNIESTQTVGVEVTGVFGLESLEQNKIKVYPNPTTDFLIINQEYSIDLSVKIKDVVGREIKKTQITSNQSKIDISSLNSGTYFITFENKDQTMSLTEKIIKF